MKPGCRRRFKSFHLLGKINSPEKAFSQRYPLQFCRARGRNPDTESTAKKPWLGRDLAGSSLWIKLCTGNCPQIPVLCSPPVCPHKREGARCLPCYPLCKPSFLGNRIYLNFQELDNKTTELFPKNNSLRFLACCLN